MLYSKKKTSHGVWKWHHSICLEHVLNVSMLQVKIINKSYLAGRLTGFLWWWQGQDDSEVLTELTA